MADENVPTETKNPRPREYGRNSMPRLRQQWIGPRPPGANAPPPSGTPIYGREALRRLREQDAAREGEAPKLPTSDEAEELPAPAARGAKRRQIHITVTAEEEQVIAELARCDGMTPSNWFRAGRGMPVVDPHRPNARREWKRREWARWMNAQLKSRDTERK